MVDQLQNIWLKMRHLEVFQLRELVVFCDFEVHPSLLAAYMVALIEAGYITEISGKKNNLLKHGRYRLLRDTGEEAPILKKDIFIFFKGRYLKADYAVYDANLDVHFPLVKEVA